MAPVDFAPGLAVMARLSVQLLLLLLLCRMVLARVEVLDVRGDGAASRLPASFLREAREQHHAHSHEPPEGREGRSMAGRLLPGDFVPTFTVPVLEESGGEGGSWTYEATFDNSNAPLFVQAYSRDDAFLQTMWEIDFYLRDLPRFTG